MRVGIVTQPLEMNYGGILQNWALQQVLKRLGHDPITIDAYQRFSTPHFVFNYVRARFMLMLGREYYLPRRYKGAMRSKRTGEFIEDHIVKTKVMWDYKPSVIKKYRLEALVVGSDQVWRNSYTKNHLHLTDLYLSFASGFPVKRVAYAASFGVDKWEYTPEQTAACAPLAQQFDAISVREQSGVELCRKHLGVDAVCTLDPTLLLESKDYERIIDDDIEVAEPYLAVYCLDINPVKEAFFNQVAKDHGLKVRYFWSGWTSPLSIPKWLGMFRNATMVVTDSFHGMVFSILFGKDFYVLCNPHRGNSRMTDLLKQLGLESRLLSDAEPKEPENREIDWAGAYSRLEKRRQESIDFLKNSLF